jgi:hypothetical protein
MDLGPVIGQNISFFGEQISCKIFIEDLFAPVGEALKRGSYEGLAEDLPARLKHEPATIDGILCWDLFDFLDKKSSQALAARLVELLRPGGILYAFFGSTNGDIQQYTRFIVETPNAFRLKQVPAPTTKRNVIVTRDVNRMFQGLTVSESVLLKSNSRETLFRKS